MQKVLERLKCWHAFGYMCHKLSLLKRIKILATGTKLQNLENTVSVPWRDESLSTEKGKVVTMNVGSGVLARTEHLVGAY